MNSVLRLAVIGFMVLALTGLAGAQGLTGNFTLPCETRWGPAILPEGDYSFTVEGWNGGRAVHLYRGTTGVAVLYAQTFGQIAKGNNELILDGSGPVKDVQRLSLPEIGLALYYAAPKHKAEPIRQIALAVPVKMTTKSR